MNRKRIRFLFVVCLGVMAIVWLWSSQRQSISIAKAAPQAANSVYLPLIVRSCTPTELVRDGGFEAGLPNSYWHTSSNTGSSILDNSSIPSPNPTHSGSWKAWLGGSNNMQETLWQVINVPAGTTQLQVSFWYEVNTSEPNPSGFDWLKVQIRDTSGTAFQDHIYVVDDTLFGATWFQKTIPVTPTYAGQTIQLAFYAYTDPSNPTSFFIDDVSVQACH